MTQSLHRRNYRHYLLGHGLSNLGMWVQQTAELWLLVLLTDSGTAVGVHSILRFGPVLIFGAHGGLFGDRVDRRRLLIATQALHAAGAMVITLAAWLGHLSVPLIYGVVLGQGLVNAVDNPLRRAFVRDLVADEELANAVSLHGAVATLTRAAGPAIAGLLIARAAVQWCFTLNAVSYASVLVVLFSLDTSKLRPQVRAPRGRRQIREGLFNALTIRALRDTLVLSFVVGIFGWNWTTILPFFTTEVLGGDASLYGALVSVLGVGAFMGALLSTPRRHVGWRFLTVSSVALATGLGIVAVSPSLPVTVVGLVFTGTASASVMVGAQARIQMHVDDAFSGRVLALYSVAFVGSKPVGGMLGGWLTDVGGPRNAFGVSSLAIVCTVVVMQTLAVRSRSGWLRWDPR